MLSLKIYFFQIFQEHLTCTYNTMEHYWKLRGRIFDSKAYRKKWYKVKLKLPVEMGLACKQALHFWQAKHAAREHTRKNVSPACLLLLAAHP